MIYHTRVNRVRLFAGYTTPSCGGFRYFYHIPKRQARAPRIVLRILATLYSLVLACSKGATTEDFFRDEEKNEDIPSFLLSCPARPYQSKCSLYMANSTIPDGGVGIFTTEKLVPGDVIGFGDIVNPLIDFYWHHFLEYADHALIDYIWQGMGILELDAVIGDDDDNHIHHHQKKRSAHKNDDIETFSRCGEVQVMGYGLEATVNCHLGLVNAASASFGYDGYNIGLLHRSRDPGAGAFSPYMTGRTLVANMIPKGGEVFKHYGDRWFDFRTETFGLIPFSGDYELADVLIQEFGLLFPEADNLATLTNLHKDLWDLMANFPYESRITNAIPKYHDRIPLVIREGIWESYLLDVTRPVEEIERTGRCLENVSHGPSTLPQAGRGAFGTRSFKAGAVITGSPLIHIQSIKFFEMYKAVQEALACEEKFKQSTFPMSSDTSDSITVYGYQIGLNYCWKHPASSLLLCPYGSGVNYINHNQTLANVKVRWGRHGEIGHDDNVLARNFTQIFQTSTPHLAFDYVALRDIELGEELFLDYGDAWENAWQGHVACFTDAPSSSRGQHKDYQSAYQWNRKHAKRDILTDRERKVSPYPSNLNLRCHAQIMEVGWTSIVPPHYQYSWTTNDKGMKCHILARYRIVEGGPAMYDVGIASSYQKQRSLGHCVEVHGVPQSAFRFFDGPYTKDYQMAGTFRFPIGIPDDILPPAWKHAS